MPSDTSTYTKVLMGMPISVKIVGSPSSRLPRKAFDAVFDWFMLVDARYSPYKPDSEVSLINAGLPETAWSEEIKLVLALCEQTKQQTDGYFDAYRNGRLDPSGLVKGWAIKKAAELLEARGYRNFSIDAGGDIQARGVNADGGAWRIGIRNPFKPEEIIKVVMIQNNEGVATSGAYIRGDHIYNPHTPGIAPRSLASVTVIGPDIYEADRFATAAYAMGKAGTAFIEAHPGFEAYMVDPGGVATMTSGFGKYTA